MSFTQGFADSHTDLLAKLKTYLTTTLSSSEQWAVERYTAGDELILSGQGYSSTDTIFIGFKAYSDSVNDNYALLLNAYTGFNNSLGFWEMPGGMATSDFPPATPLLKSIPTNANAIKYWFFADAAHVKIVARTGTVYHQTYQGLYLPYGSPPTYPYPQICGGSCVTNASLIPLKNSDTSTGTQSYWKPQDAYNTNPISAHLGSLAVREPGGSWLRLYNTHNSGQSNYSACSGTFPYVESIRGYLSGIDNMRSNLDGTYSLQDVQVITGNPANILGTFINLKHTTGFGLAPEDEIQDENSDSWIVFPNVFRTADGEIILYKLA